jgi:sugar phosphate permease
MDKDMNFTGNQYSLLILLFHVPFGIMDLPLTLLTKRFSGKKMLPVLIVGWGSMATIQAAATSFAGMLPLRLLLASFEAGFYCGVIFYLTLFYTRGELSFRLAIFFGSALLAAAFSGLISFGVFQIEHPDIHGWQWLFLIEGGATIIVGVTAFFWLPAHPENAWFLDDNEKAAARARTHSAMDRARSTQS